VNMQICTLMFSVKGYIQNVFNIIIVREKN